MIDESGIKEANERATALTPEEWARGEFWREDVGIETYIHPHANREDRPLVVTVHSGGSAIIERSVRRPLAALLLHGQPFGFTWEDVDALSFRGDGYDECHDQDRLESLADRIAALLPPKEVK